MMRIRRLDLTRYGRFTERAIDFGPKAEDTPDFHIIHGPNEAGKSTLFSAWLDFLYGIDARSPYNFLHDYKMMRVGAVVETAAGGRALMRVKKQAGSLLDQNDQAVSDLMLAGDLGGIDREGYRNMFSLDETSLEKGGEAILANKGEVGQLLFSASAGVSDLAGRLDAIREETNRFHRPRVHSSDLIDLKRRLDELKAERDAVDIAAAEHARLVAACDRARQMHEEASRRRGEARVQLEKANARLAALPHLARLRRMRDELRDMDIVPPAPDGWRRELAELDRRQVELQATLERLSRDMRAVEAEIAAAPAPDPLLERSAELETLHELAGRALSEERDLPNRIADRDAAQRKIEAITARLGQQDCADPRMLLLSARTLAGLRELIASRSGIEARFESAAQEMDAARRALEEARLQWSKEDVNSDPGDADQHLLAELADQLSALKAVDLDQREMAARQDLEAATGKLAHLVAQLRPWADDPAALQDIVVPGEAELADLRRQQAEAVEAMRQAERGLAGLRDEIAERQAEHAAARASGAVTDGEAQSSRMAREDAWAAHRASLAAETADRFRQLLDADDRLTEERMQHAADIAALRSLDQTLARLRTRLTNAERDHAAAVAGMDAVREAVARAASTAGLPAEMGLGAFEAWCMRLSVARDGYEAERSARRSLQSVRDMVEVRCDRLRRTLAELGVAVDDQDLLRLISVAHRLQAGIGRRAALAGAIEQAERDLERRETARAGADAARQDWKRAWAAALDGSWLAAAGVPPPAAEVSEILEQLRTLESEFDRYEAATDRIGKMERDIALFAAELRSLAGDLGLDTDLPPHTLHRRIGERLAEAGNEAARRAALGKRQSELAEEHDDLLRKTELTAARIGGMAERYGTQTVAELEENLALADRRVALEAEIRRLSIEIAESLGGAEPEGLDALEDDIDRDALAAQVEMLRPEVAALDEQTAEAYAELSAAGKRLASLGSDGEAARLAEARRTVLIEIEEGARRYLELRLGALATDQALRLYRDRHQSSMMMRASEAFRQLTRGNYRMLTTQRDGQREALVAVAADGSSKEAEDLSRGTQFQLYLALRVAGYQEYAASRPPVPFIADDIMESFDEARSEEALTQLSIMARSGQVIYLTHHLHICDIARTVCPTVTVHSL
jgi:uncharacterized protein YhaN